MLKKYIVLIILILLLFFLKKITIDKFGINPLIFLHEIKDYKDEKILEPKHIKKMEEVLKCYQSNDYYNCINRKKLPYIKPLR